ncbi:hypothetical protein CLV91_3183 [Maribacter vaceletii]|uniref:Uncharacterized protein n=1 Tax=Maribacter vaceletii TaxID=1206816 RepID=A0A495DS46_9FLAO|nr:hypothetical protein [Maribacter vaceletii]RKR06955.1 hypothetical protein CLV91_3183 [Maribacter vaceletii]
MKLIITTLFFSFCFCLSTYGQIKIGDNPQTIDASSVLELESTSHVLVITRVTTAQMNAITPSPGGMVYNIDEECIHYYTGTIWINLCEAGGISNLTTDPLVNDFRTIVITPQGDINHIEVGIIRGEQLADNSIDTSKLAENSVTANELSDNAVGTNELLDNSIEPVDFANTDPDQVLTTDENGIVLWANATSLTNVNTDATITGNGSVASPLAVSGTVTAAIQANTTANTNDTDGDENNEIQQLSINPAGTRISLTNGGSVNLPPGTVNTDSQTLSITANTLAITGGNSVPLTPYLDNTDEQNLTRTGNTINITGGTGVDLSPILTSGADGSETIIDAINSTVGVAGTGTTANPYILTATAGDGSETIIDAANSTVGVAGTGTTANPYILTATAGDGSETIIDAANSTVGVAGTGTTANPYILTATAGDGSETIIDAANSTVGVAGTGTTTNPYILTATAGDGSETIIDALNSTIDVTGDGTSLNPYTLTTTTITNNISLLQTEQITQNNAIALNTAKVGISLNSITNADINLTASIDGTKINPNFGGQDIATTGGLSVGDNILLNGNLVVPDYVFQKYFNDFSPLNPSYTFNDLTIIENFIKENHHLPGIKSAKEIKEQGFWNLGEASQINLEKIEELFLHTIEQEKKIKALEKDKNNLSKELNSLKKEIELIKEMLSNK